MSEKIIRVTEDLKQKLEDCEGSNFTERIENYAKDQEDVNNSLTLPEVKSAVEDALVENLNDQALDRY